MNKSAKQKLLNKLAKLEFELTHDWRRVNAEGLEDVRRHLSAVVLEIGEARVSLSLNINGD